LVELKQPSCCAVGWPFTKGEVLMSNQSSQQNQTPGQKPGQQQGGGHKPGQQQQDPGRQGGQQGQGAEQKPAR